ncbi:phage major capsid protein [Pseudonocardia benzenivorans]
MSAELLKRLQDERLGLWEDQKRALDTAEGEKRDLDAAESKAYDERNARMDAIDARLKELVEGEKRAKDAGDAFDKLMETKRTGPPAPAGGEDVNAKLRAFLRGESGRAFEITPSERDRAPFRQSAEEARDLTVGSATAGGNTVPTSFYNRLVAHLIEVSGLLMLAPTVLNTTSGEALQIPKTTAHGGAALVAEGAGITESDPTFGQVTLNAYKYGVLLQISYELTEDTGVDLEGYLAMQAGRATGNAFGAHAITGDNSGKPNGVATAATSGVTGGTGVTGAFTSDNLIDLHYSVIAPYRNSPSCGWLMKDATVGSVRKLKDSTGQYLWQPSLQVGAPDTLLGKPIHTDPNVAGVGLGARSVLFGDFSQYFVRFVRGLRFERSDDYAFNQDLITYRCLMRADGDLVDTTGAIKCFVGGAS